MANWYKLPSTFRISESEYRANINGMNIVFGAVLGFVLAGADGLAPTDFMIVLFVTALAVILILYLGSTEYTLFYGGTAGLLIYFLPDILSRQFDINLIPNLQPTLIVWAFMVALVEFTPRIKASDKQSKEPIE